MTFLQKNNRTHNNSELNASHLGQIVTLYGWVHRRRDHGGLVFVDLRDRYGLTQVVFDPNIDTQAHTLADQLRIEFTIGIRGIVKARPEGQSNTKLATGAIEVYCQELCIFSKAKTPPFPINEEADTNENVKLRYRYLDIRRPQLSANLALRSKFLQIARSFFSENNFIEVETPVLYKTTPEGARDFLVPSRLQKGKFYALPQSPQTLKQLLMIGGMDRYFQVTRCFRDEDLRADRQPEFTQLDLEMSFMNEEQIINTLEKFVISAFQKTIAVTVPTPIRRINFDEAIEKFGTDAPDIRYDLHIKTLNELLKNNGSNIFKNTLKLKDGRIAGIYVEGTESLSRKELDELASIVAPFGAKGCAWIKIKPGQEWQGPLAKQFLPDERTALEELWSMKPEGGIVFLISDRKKVTYSSLGALRKHLANRLGLIKPHVYEFCWVLNFPLFEYNEQDSRYYAAHHPFTSPRPEHMDWLINQKTELFDDLKAQAYDLVCNGQEIGGGSIRIFDESLQKSMFKALGIAEEEARQKFGFFMEALQYGTPPHGGFAFGLDRLLQIMTGSSNIREVIAFPKTSSGICLMSNAPSEADEAQLHDVGIKINPLALL